MECLEHADQKAAAMPLEQLTAVRDPFSTAVAFPARRGTTAHWRFFPKTRTARYLVGVALTIVGSGVQGLLRYLAGASDPMDEALMGVVAVSAIWCGRGA